MTLSVQDRVSGLVKEEEMITIMSMIMIMRMTPILTMHEHVVVYGVPLLLGVLRVVVLWGPKIACWLWKSETK